MADLLLPANVYDDTVITIKIDRALNHFATAFLRCSLLDSLSKALTVMVMKLPKVVQVTCYKESPS